MRPSPSIRFLAIVLIAFCLEQSAAVRGDDRQLEFFESRIRPVLIEHCYECHNSRRSEGELSLDFREGLRRGGSRGSVIDDSDKLNSLLLKVIRHEIEELKMPEGGSQLDAATIADFEKWVADGAIDPRDEAPTQDELEPERLKETIFRERRKWWALQLLQSPPTPIVDQPHWSNTDIDRFLYAAMQAKQLEPSNTADRRTLLRRAFIALTGLAPTEEQIRQFESDPSKDALEKRIDDLLDSPQFGERWARHWMDWIRYAESHGSEGDPAIPYAYEYRDYIIRALNEDVPYHRLILEHLAGDLLPAPRINSELGLNESVIGASQLRMVFHGFSPTDALEEKVRFVDDQINVLSKAFLGLTVSCARCHDHKFDAISQKDYYAMFGVFSSCRLGIQDANTLERQHLHRERLTELKRKIQERLSDSWLKSLEVQLAQSVASDTLDLESLAKIENDTQLLQSWRVLLAASRGPKNDPIHPAIQRVLEAMIRHADRADSESNSSRQDNAIDLELSTWYGFGNGTGDQPVAAGSFAIANEGEQILQGVYPRGRYSHLLSNKHRGALLSPTIKLDGNYRLWVLASGESNASIRYCVQDFPRNGTIYPINNLDPNRWLWFSYNLDYWNGDRIHVELTTAGDAPVLARNEPRSWVGVRRALLLPGDLPPNLAVEFQRPLALAKTIQRLRPTDQGQLFDACVSSIRDAVTAWKSGTMNDEQALWMDELLRSNLLSNRIDTHPDCRSLLDEYRRLEAEVPIPRRVPGLLETQGEDHALLNRGNHRQPGESIPRRFLEAIDDQPLDAPQSGRLELARKFASPRNPLVARVIVNRLWHHLFGQGIVATPDNFGKLGQLPSHAPLLDHLANEFIQDGWSIKRAIRKMMLTRAWQLDSLPSESSKSMDPENRYFAHANLRRVDAEVVRDRLLQATGKLDRTPYGPSVDSNSPRRSIYLRVQRNSLDPFLRAFDFPEPSSTVGRRDETNVPAQALMMMNDAAVARYASDYALQLLQKESTFEGRIQLLAIEVLGRPFTMQESDAIHQFQADLRQAVTTQARKREQLESELADTKKTESQWLEKAREIIASETLSKSIGSNTTSSLTKPIPILRWEFEQNESLSENLAAKLNGDVNVQNGQLQLRGGYLVAGPIGRSIREKTLEVWVKPSNLEQRGGGILTLQSPNGEVFDSIVYGEAESHRWMAGSELFRRTASFQGDAETELSRMTHIAICYDSNGQIRGYRNGVPYGSAYASSGPVDFAADTMVTIGLRHLPQSGNRTFSGTVERAQVYDRALTADEVLESYRSQPHDPSDQELLARLDASQREIVEQARARSALLRAQIQSMGNIPKDDLEVYLWSETTRAMLASKEFLFVR